MYHLTIKLIATIGFIGYIPKGPGTAGSAFAMILAYFLFPHFSFNMIWLLISLSCLFGWLAASLYEKEFNLHDDKAVVVDELAGLWLAYGLMLSCDITIIENPLIDYGVMFLLFRIFDIFKPFPIGWLDKNINGTPFIGGLGTMLDDLAAGLAAFLLFYAITFIL